MTGKNTAAFQHLPLFDETQPWQTEIYQARMVRNVLVQANPTWFRPDFAAWHEANPQIFEAFNQQANLIWDRGTRRYSARTIGEYLRHESALREGPNEHGWKLNNNYWPDLGRLYLLLHPDREGFFERRAGVHTLRAV